MTATVPTNVALPNGRKVPVQPTLLVDESGNAITSLGGGGTSDATANNQTVVQANPGSDATKAIAIQGITGGKPLPASQSGAWSITNISGTISLPTGAATESTLAAQSAKLPPSLGQKVSANSLSVTIASDQTALPLPAGAANSTNQASLLAKLPTALGRIAAANSFSVVLSTEDKAALDGVALSLPSSGTEKFVTANSTPQDICALNASRKSFSFQNTSKTGYVWVREGADAGVANGQLLGPGATYIAETKARISVTVDSGSANCYCYGLEY